MNELEKYTTEELKAELTRRWNLKKAQRDAVDRCRNCQFLMKEKFYSMYLYRCEKRTYFSKKRGEVHYCVQPSTRACEFHKRKQEDEKETT